MLPWVDGLEVINGTRLPSQNRTALCLAAASGKHTLGGGDSHTGRGIGLTWTEVPGARTRQEFLRVCAPAGASPAARTVDRAR